MLIEDNFLSERELKYWKTKVQEGNTQGVLLSIPETMLWNKIRKRVKLPLLNAYLYAIPADTPANPHMDKKQFAVIFYPFTSQSSLALYTPDWQLNKIIPVVENRCIFFECSEHIHSQISTRDKGVRHSVVFKFSLQT